MADTAHPLYRIDLVESEALDVLASVETMRDITKDAATRGRLTALLDNIQAQLGATKEG